jgi:hypothetical protein
MENTEKSHQARKSSGIAVADFCTVEQAGEGPPVASVFAGARLSL